MLPKTEARVRQFFMHLPWRYRKASGGIFDTSERIDEDEIDTAPSDNYNPGNYVWHYRPITYSL